MRLLFTCASGESHFYNVVPFAAAARDRGHEVVFSTAADLADVVGAAGFPIEPSGSGRLRLRTAMKKLTQAGDDSEDPGAVLFGQVAPTLKWRPLVDVIRTVRPDAVVSEFLDVAGPLGARIAGVPGYTLSIGPYHRDTLEDLWRHAGPLYQSLLGPDSTASDLMGRYIDVCPPELQSPEGLALPDRLPARVGTYHGADTGRSAVLFDTGPRPRVLVTFGTVSNAAVAGMTAAADRLAAAGFQVVLTRGPQGWFDTGRPVGSGAGAASGDHVRLVDYSPLERELAVTAVVVHHGGSNTMRAAIEAAVPSVVIPQGTEQLRNAKWIAGNQLGDRLMPGQADAATVTESVRRVVADPAITRGLRSARSAWLAMPDATGVLLEMERAEKGRRGTARHGSLERGGVR